MLDRGKTIVFRVAIGILVMQIYYAMATPRFTETPAPGQFLSQSLENRQLGSGALVILDLDDTTITTPEGQWLGRSETFYHMVEQEARLNPDKGRMDIIRDIEALLLMVYPHTRVQLTDPELPEVINRLKARGITVIGMTARGLSLAQITLDQLEKAGVEFSNTGPLRTLLLEGERQVRIDRGIVFAGQQNSKGETLLALQADKVLSIPAQVMLVDDRKRHLLTVKDALHRHDSNVSYHPVLCTYLADKKAFDPQESEQQLLAFLYEKREDAKIFEAVRQSPFSQSWVRRCQSNPAADSKHCNTLIRQLDRH